MLKETLDILVEPITKNSLFLSESNISNNQIIEGVLKDKSGKEYKIHDGLADFIPKKEYLTKDSPLLETWCKLQESGKKLYDTFPHLNLSVKGRKDVKIFKEFSLFHGKVLDVGCGPFIPAYLEDNKEVEFAIGIDPLVTSYNYNKTEHVDLLKAIGEFMPFADKSFDIVSFATSFDHVIDPITVLSETKRILNNDGQAIFWIEGMKYSPQEQQAVQRDHTSRKINLEPKLKRIIRKTIKITKKQICLNKYLGLDEQAKIIDSMEIPEGAIDKFHLRHVNYNEFDEICKMVGFRLIEKKELPEFRSTFVRYNIS